uniref:Ubiquitin-like modifier-activating enzyme Atg7 N-terminal domain-containing protein n=1 Tax=Amphimedon queenslandica TaxID=400682 RepID=A0A1X7SNR4_AMPQE
SLDPGYWQELGRRKLEDYQLREDPVPIRSSYGNYRRNITVLSTRPFLSLDYTAFDVGSEPTGLDFPFPGLLQNMNSILLQEH